MVMTGGMVYGIVLTTLLYNTILTIFIDYHRCSWCLKTPTTRFTLSYVGRLLDQGEAFGAQQHILIYFGAVTWLERDEIQRDGNRNPVTHRRAYNSSTLCLVGGFKHFLFSIIYGYIYIWDNPSHWLIFFRVVKTTNQTKSRKFGRVFVCDFGEWVVPNQGLGSRSRWAPHGMSETSGCQKECRRCPP